MPRGVYDRRPQPTAPAVQARRDEYARLRDSGLSHWDAAGEMGIDRKGAGRRYEHWYTADPEAILRPSPVTGEG